MTTNKTDYAGTDYGLGKSNINSKTGIRYGVISAHSVSSEALDDIFSQGRNLSHESAVEERKKEIEQAITNYVSDDRLKERVDEMWQIVEEEFSKGYTEDEDCYLYEKDGYKIQTMSNGNIMVLESPFVANCQFCSPCIPGAGNLDKPCDTGPNTYALGPEWFDEEFAPMPYEVRSVDKQP